FVTAVHNTRSSSERTRRRLPSPELMMSAAWLAPSRRVVHRRWRARSRGSGDNQSRAWFRERDILGARHHRVVHWYVLRHQHDELPILLDAARNVTDLLAVPEIYIGTCRSDDRRTRVLRKQQTAKFGLGLFAFDRELSVYPDRRSINMDALIHRQRAPSRKRNTLGTNAFIVSAQRCFPEKDERTIFAAQGFTVFRIRFHVVADLVHRHFFLGNDAAIDQKFSNRRIRHAVACNVVEAQQLAIVELDPCGPLDLRKEYVDWTFDVTNLEVFAGQRAILNLGAIEIGKYRAFLSSDCFLGCRVNRDGVFIAWEARTVDLRFVITGEETLRLAARHDPDRLEVVFTESTCTFAIELTGGRRAVARLE